VSQLILFVALQVLGIVICMAVGPWQRIWLCCALGFVVGLASMVVLSLGVLLLGGFQLATMLAVYLVVLGVCVAWSARQRRWNRNTLLAAACGVVGFATLCLPFCDFNVSSFSYDSHMFVMYGRVLGEDGRLTLSSLAQLNAWGVFQVVAHAMGAFVSVDYLYGLAPAFAVSMVATFAALVGEGLGELRVPRRHRALWMGLAVAVLLAIPLFRFHAVYIHANLASSGFLLCFVALFWLAEVRSDATYVPIAFLSLLAFTLLRVEAVPYAVIFLGLTVLDSKLPRRALLPWYLLYTSVLVAWFALMSRSVPADSVYLTPIKCLAFGAVLAMLFVYWLIKDRWLFRHLTRYVPHLLVGVCALGIAYGAVTHGDNMRESAGIWLRDLWKGPYWAWIWKVAALLAVVGVFVPAPPFRKPLVLGIWLFFGVTLIISSTGTAFGPGMDGSLIRMTLHILPVVMFYGALKFAPLLSATRAR
jgi:hypothetical protein